MPRGDKKAIMNYQVPDLSYQAQKIIGEFLNVFDRKIELNNKLNDNLQQQIAIIFKAWFVDFKRFISSSFAIQKALVIRGDWPISVTTLKQKLP